MSELMNIDITLKLWELCSVSFIAAFTSSVLSDIFKWLWKR